MQNRIEGRCPKLLNPNDVISERFMAILESFVILNSNYSTSTGIPDMYVSNE